MGAAVVDLAPGGVADTALVGGKAMGLQRLMDASLPCPPAFCVTTAALDGYLDERGLRERLGALIAALPDERAQRELRSIAFEEELPGDLVAGLDEAIERLGARLPGVELVAVRSSAADEDSGSHSFAGLHETQLGVRLTGVGAAVRKCWASLWSEAAIAYRRENGLPVAETTMAVVVQALVPAKASAVVFTANPLTGDPGEVLVHATCGLGPTLVDNEVTPDVAVLRKRDLVVRKLDVGDKHLRIDPRAAGGLVRSRRAGDEPALTEAELVELARLAVEAERRLGAPVDIEAALGEGWQLIQARPITTLADDRMAA
jgi:phosphoenolpyruvate synthase/pyruvate phosphate dikinase